MTTRVLKGSKQEIARQVANLEGEVREAIVFIEEPAKAPTGQAVEDIFAEMEPYVSGADQVDDSREAIYERMEGE
jgi:hypothetical protein